ncbi:MAG TPA: SRPBCC family protein [Bryobacteraceae bacterium]
MKWLKWIGIVLAALLIPPIVTLFILSLRKDAGHLHGSIEIAASPQQLFPWLVEGAKLKQWVGWLVEVRVSDPANRGVGTSCVWVMKDANNGGRPMEIVAKTREYAPPSHLVLQISSEGQFTGDNVYELVDLGNGRTRLEVDSRFHFSNWFVSLMEPVVTPAARKKMIADEVRLKALVESKAEVR